MDLLRSVAILLVIVAHTVLSYGAPIHLAPLQFGGTGVDLFFVLSGWLLGGQLFKEAVTQKSVDVKRFWIRRWMRTFPAYYAVLTATVIQRYLTKDNVVFPWEYFLFIQNYHHPLEFFSISWSLCVEEQFYLLIAPLVALSIYVNRQTTIWLLVATMLVPFLFRQTGLYGNMEETHVRIDGCVAGVLLAHIHRQHQEVWQKLVRAAPAFAFVGLAAFIYFVIARYFPEISIGEPDKLILAAIFSSWVLLANATDKWRQLIYVPGAYYIATRSYALYLVHPDVLALLKRFALGLNFPLYLILAIAGSIIVSEALYRVVEKPFMDAREKYNFSRSPKGI